MTQSLNAPGFSPLRAKWGWFLALGLVLLAFGVIALGNLLVATVASVFYVGIMMLMGGILQLLHAFQVKGWESVLFWTLSGLLYAIAGVIAFQNPDLTAAVLTLLMAISLVVAGVFRLVVGFRLKPSTGWGWVAAAGAVTALAGLVIAAGWPVNSLWVLGLFLAIDLIMQGFAMIASPWPCVHKGQYGTDAKPYRIHAGRGKTKPPYTANWVWNAFCGKMNDDTNFAGSGAQTKRQK